MRFSVDAHAIGCHLTGNEVYVRNLLHQFARLDGDNEFVAYLSKPFAELDVPERFERRHVSANPFRRLGFDLPKRVRADRPDLLHVQYTGPLSCPVPMVVSVHDVSYLEFPRYFTRFRATQLKLTVKRTIHAAARVLTPSEFSRDAILRNYAIDERKVVVIPNAASSVFRPIERQVAAAAVERKYGIHGPFVLTVGDLQPRKNHLGLLSAFKDVVCAHPQLPHRLGALKAGFVSACMSYLVIDNLVENTSKVLVRLFVVTAILTKNSFPAVQPVVVIPVSDVSVLADAAAGVSVIVCAALKVGLSGAAAPTQTVVTLSTAVCVESEERYPTSKLIDPVQSGGNSKCV